MVKLYKRPDQKADAHDADHEGYANTVILLPGLEFLDNLAGKESQAEAQDDGEYDLWDVHDANGENLTRMPSQLIARPPTPYEDVLPSVRIWRSY